MSVSYDILVPGSSIGLKNGFIGWGMIALVETDGTRILFDCGHAVTRLALRQGLKRNRLEPDDIDIVFLSHLHFDHALNIDMFANSKIMVSETEWAYAADPHPDDDFVHGYIRGVLEKMDLEIFSGEPEIAGGVKTLHAPGHTPGLHALTFSHDEKGSVVIAGDAIKTARELISEQVVMEFDAEKRSSATIARIKAMADIIVPGHYTPFRKLEDGGFIWDDPIEMDLLFR